MKLVIRIRGFKYGSGVKIMRFSANKSLYLGNGAR